MAERRKGRQGFQHQSSVLVTTTMITITILTHNHNNHHQPRLALPCPPCLALRVISPLSTPPRPPLKSNLDDVEVITTTLICHSQLQLYTEVNRRGRSLTLQFPTSQPVSQPQVLSACPDPTEYRRGHLSAHPPLPPPSCSRPPLSARHLDGTPRAPSERAGILLTDRSTRTVSRGPPHSRRSR